MEPLSGKRAGGAAPEAASPRALLTLAWIAGFTLIDSSIVSLALPDVARDFDRSVAELAWVSRLPDRPGVLTARRRLAD